MVAGKGLPVWMHGGTTMSGDILSLDAKRPPAERYGACIDRLQRILGFLDCIRDSLELAADEHDESLGSRLWVCDFMHREIVMIFETLRDIGAAIGPELCNSTAAA
ncbi:MAG: hypothetical protein JST22_13750 [Bacteroidetes bacterium]|nr:hypothetical protein [Bacteroidota bacterium]